ncbi:bifunctional UDP-N-acetylmuramoyl-tripeptide:D-alanyl-D-alanine ligase/alanine racemase [Cytophagaceae bacterium DM2B3-1]|uniref:Alanine racemase n=1 Tax=Xanthocytophaga flava TaxID=3048013 RepID=A0ABT7CF44_9BACT|nr:bifunctional UDP-N-acetylmuramoyl-tripeptide:D-alanyl-D-alanine ligase/alanine racemase [Xanthocytophaga flavus]MDJ1491349.1 bifunctional UDP-N-acetylmuramoyl-tripeptide:D-alanyl-D-alanine ligase/alanine racemase [Xanthocytophaga flavus]
MLYFSQLPEITGGKILSATTISSPIEHLLIDSRRLTAPATSLFFAINGERHDGHQFVKDLYAKGVRQFVIEENNSYISTATDLQDALVIIVSNSVRALQRIAAWHRNQFSIPVIGITGSNGKTIVKEWLTTLLSNKYQVVKSPRSYNSQVGVPLSVWQINGSHTLGIFEAGISQPDEMVYLEKTIQPTIGIFTNIGTAHDEGFISRQQKIAEKAKLFEHCEAVVYCEEHTEIHEYLSAHLPSHIKRWTWKRIDMSLASMGKGESENLMHCITLMQHLGISQTEIETQLQLIHPVSMRLELKQGIRGCYLIDDTYNNDLAGLQIALDFLSNQQQRAKKTVILSDVLESGEPEKQLYTRIAALVHSKNIDRLIGIGEVISRNADCFNIPTLLFPTTESFLKKAHTLFSNELILIKGARTFRFERIIQKLQQKTHGTVLEINLDAIVHNLNYFRSKLKPHTKLMAMVKAFAYGSGSAEVASLLQFHRVDYLTVAYADEGVILRENGITLPIMVMNPSEETFQQIIDYQLEPEIYSPRILQEFLNFLENNDQSAKIHVKVETGMHRLGFEEEHIPQLINKLQNNHHRVQVAAIFSHLAASDDPTEREYTLQQIKQLDKISSLLTEALGYKPIRHIVNSAGIAHYPEGQFDMVRLGIGLYGVGANETEQEHLKTVGTLKTTISQIKHEKPGETVGYGRRGKVTRDSTTATIAIGYADGFDRRFSIGTGSVWINGQLAPVIGSVCMDMSMVDITNIEAQEGDEVIIFGEQLPVQQLARWAGTIPYEIMTGISERVKRIFYTE